MIWALLTTLALAQAVDERKSRPDSDDAAASDAVDARKTRPTGPDRSAPPEVAPPSVLDQPEPKLHELWPGLTAWHVRVPSVRKVEIAVIPRIGALDLVERDDGRASATGWLMDTATETWDSTALEILQDLNDMDVSSGMENHYGTIGVSVPRADLELGLEVLGEVLTSPAFSARDLKLHQREMSVWQRVLAAQSQSQVARSALTHTWYPADHPYGTRADIDALMSLKRKDLAAVHAQWLASAPAHVIVVGDLPWKAIEPGLKQALKGVGVEGVPSEELAFEPAPGVRVMAVDMPGQEQVAIQYRIDAPHRTDADQPALWAANWILGGHFLSRLNANLREDKGLTYGSRSSYWPSDTRGSLTISVDVKAENMSEAVTEIGHEVARLRDETVTTDELAAAYASEVSSWNDTRQSAGSAMGLYRRLFQRDQSVADAQAKLEGIAALTPAVVQDAASRWLGPDAPQVWVFVGSREALEPELEALGLDAEWTTARAAIDGTF
jgi:predicted Zn-dependent peptidase